MKLKCTTLFFCTLKALSLALIGGCSELQIVNSVSKIYSVDVKKNLSFGSHPTLKYDLYLPRSVNSDLNSTPVLVFFYGGSWRRGDKSEYEFVGRRLASMGYIAAIPNYRLYPEVKYPDFLDDGARSIAHLKTELTQQQYLRYKPATKYIMMGHSAGAYNAAMLAFDTRWLNAVGLSHQETIQGFIGLAGAYNFYPIINTEVKPVFEHPNYPAKSQPIDHASQPQTPTLILAPETDTLVSIESNSDALHRILQLAGNPSQLEQIKGTDHISLLGTLSPLLFFKGSTTKPIQKFISAIYSRP